MASPSAQPTREGRRGFQDNHCQGLYLWRSASGGACFLVEGAGFAVARGGVACVLPSTSSSVTKSSKSVLRLAPFPRMNPRQMTDGRRLPPRRLASEHHASIARQSPDLSTATGEVPGR